MSDLNGKVKGQPLYLEFIDNHCLIRLYISSETIDLGFLACNDRNAFLLEKNLKSIMHGHVKMYVMR